MGAVFHDWGEEAWKHLPESRLKVGAGREGRKSSPRGEFVSGG